MTAIVEKQILKVEKIIFREDCFSCLDQWFSTFGTVGPVDKFFNQIGPVNVVYFD